MRNAAIANPKPRVYRASSILTLEQVHQALERAGYTDRYRSAFFDYHTGCGAAVYVVVYEDETGEGTYGYCIGRVYVRFVENVGHVAEY